MTVAELIAELQKMPQDAVVCCDAARQYFTPKQLRLMDSFPDGQIVFLIERPKGPA